MQGELAMVMDPEDNARVEIDRLLESADQHWVKGL